MRRLVPAAALVLSLSGCAGDAEKLVLLDFFGAARLHDRTALAALATTDFAPNLHGVVLRFDVLSVSSVRRRALSSDSEDGTLARISLAHVQPTGLNPPAPEGQRLTKDVTIDATIRRPDGETVKREIVATLERAVFGTGQAVSGRWVVTGLADRGPSRRQAG
jgi:hypothetical protein